MKRTRKQLSGQALKDFRHSVAILKSKGLIRKSVDARKQAPTQYMRAKVKALSDVIAGKQTGVKVSKEILKKARAENQRVVNGRVLAPAGQPKMQAAVRKGQFIEVVTPMGPRHNKREIDLSRFYSMEQFINTFLDHPHDLDRLRPKDYQFAITYFGNRSRITFPTAKDMLAQLEFYILASGFDIHDYSKATDAALQELWDGFSLFTVENNGNWQREATAIVQDRRKRAKKAYMDRMVRNDPERALKWLDYKARKQQKKRDNMSPEQREIYKAKARARAAASYDRQKEQAKRETKAKK